MKRPKLPTSSAIAGLVFASLLAGGSFTYAASASTGPLGYTTIECLWESDTLCSAAGITESPDFVGKLADPPVSGSTITVDAAPGWTADTFADTHYVRFTDGSNIGRYYTVTANGANTLTLDLGGDNLSSVVAGAGVTLIKYWTLGTLFPAASQTTIVPSLGTIGFQRRTEVLFPDLMSAGINLSTPSTSIYYLIAAGWRSSVGNTPSDDVIILPDMYFIVRHPAQSLAGGLGDADGTEFVPLGAVDESPSTIALNTQADPNGPQDTAAAIARPVAVALNEAGLIASGAFLPSLGTLGFQRRDELLVFDLDVDTISALDSGINRSSVNSYYYNGVAGNWVNVSTGLNADAEMVFQPGAGVKVRKYNTDGLSTFWVFDPQNLQP